MNSLLLFLSLFALVSWLGIGILMIQARRHLRSLEDIPPLADPDCPSLSVIIPARNEERNIEQALRSVLSQDYPAIEFLVIDDRSTDGTGLILHRLAETDSRLRVITIHSLPSGWLGKNYALHRGAQEASGEFVLFTDADIVMHPQTLRKALGYLRANRLDHLTIAPETTMKGIWLPIVAATFGFAVLVLFQPWKMRNPNSRRHIGIGAFNLVRARAYRAVGGHRPIAMRPDDDLKLGKLFKNHGYRQDLLLGHGMIFVEWYGSVRDMIQGLMKNTFAGVDYRISFVVLGTILSLAVHVWPFIGLAIATGLPQLISASTVGLILCVFAGVIASQGLHPIYAVLFPFAVSLLLYIQWKAMLTALWTKGITWRGTHYPLNELKANKV